MKKIALALAVIAIASAFIGCGPKTEDATNPSTTAGGNGKPDAKEPASE